MAVDAAALAANVMHFARLPRPVTGGAGGDARRKAGALADL